ncbi:hypothetical protein LVJ94_10700 [Pendulispora rubella]|uniref:Uncharacterized protein n=1 Tax=Pendulispora rubella TaxID=2741070 RepID=A0ABZ2LAA7_9BACT
MDRRGWQKLGRLSGAASFVVVLGTVLWAGGCSDSDAYCDGYGCSGSGGGNGGPIDASTNTDAGKIDSGKDDAGSPQCEFPGDCPNGKSCVNGQCLPTCKEDAGNTCGNGYKCVKGVCQPEPGQPQCNVDKDCSEAGNTPKCRGGRCVQACDPANPKCPDGQVCDQGGACVPDTGPKPNCTATDLSKCRANQSCVNGFCRYPCDNSETCRLIDARLSYCGTDKVCHLQCQQSCPSPQTCIDGACK